VIVADRAPDDGPIDPPSVADLDALDADACSAALAPLFEGAPRFLARLVAARPFGGEATLFELARRLAHTIPEPEQVELIDAHPRLGARPDSVSPLSRREQGYDPDAEAAAANALADAAAAVVEAERQRVAAELRRLNDAYERRFGFRYCVFVAGRSPAALLPGMEASLGASREAELHRALDAVVDIAADRYRNLAVR
jgi:2-oxo-4-hydroxy-4-carboxy-5-ureidoimidazoline decarboxylase